MKARLPVLIFVAVFILSFCSCGAARRDKSVAFASRLADDSEDTVYFLNGPRLYSCDKETLAVEQFDINVEQAFVEGGCLWYMAEPPVSGEQAGIWRFSDGRLVKVSDMYGDTFVTDGKTLFVPDFYGAGGCQEIPKDSAGASYAADADWNSSADVPIIDVDRDGFWRFEFETEAGLNAQSYLKYKGNIVVSDDGAKTFLFASPEMYVYDDSLFLRRGGEIIQCALDGSGETVVAEGWIHSIAHGRVYYTKNEDEGRRNSNNPCNVYTISLTDGSRTIYYLRANQALFVDSFEDRAYVIDFAKNSLEVAKPEEFLLKSQDTLAE